MWKATSRTCLISPAYAGERGSLTGGAFRTAGGPLPRRPAGCQELQNALRTGTRPAW